MKRLPALIAAAACLVGGAFADDREGKVPSLEVLTSLVGMSPSSDRFRGFLRTYDMSENPKRENSWGSSFGVLLEVRNDRVQVGIRPPSDATNMPTYSAKLPKGLKEGDSIAELVEKLGAPEKTAQDPAVYYEMKYDGMTVCTMRGKLFEVWLIARGANDGGDKGSAAAGKGLFDNPIELFSEALLPGFSHSERARIQKTWRGFFLRADTQAGMWQEHDPSERGIYLNVAVRDPEELPVFKDESVTDGAITTRTVEFPAPENEEVGLRVTLAYGKDAPEEALAAIRHSINGVIKAVKPAGSGIESTPDEKPNPKPKPEGGDRSFRLPERDPYLQPDHYP